MPRPPAPHRLTVESLTAPLGLDERTPRFSWQLRPGRRHQLQTAYRLVVETRPATGTPAVIWDSGRVASDESHLVPYAGPALTPHTDYTWRVEIWTAESDQASSATASAFGTGFLGEAWPAEAAWIGLPLPDHGDVQPVRQLRRAFELPAAPASARLYITAHGLFEAALNGDRVGQDVLTPGWTDYHQRLDVLTYDVTGLLRAGPNTLGTHLAEGWFAGELGFLPERHLYGTEPGLRACLRIVDTAGGVTWLTTDDAWQARASATLAASLYHGEIHDARRELADWCAPRPARAGGWRPVVLQAAPDPAPALAGKPLPPVRVVAERTPRARTSPAKGVFIYDLGQNMVGVARLRVRAPRGTKIRLRFAEILQADGTLYTENLRRARATDTYICAGGGVETWTPRFTFHGFRFVEITGLPGRPLPDAITGLVWTSDLAPAGDFTCSHPLVNQLQSNIQWGQRGNFLDVPTDCPQRDERMGWSGDAQVFAPTALFNFAAGPFWRKYCRDLRDAQYPDGAFTDVAPDILAILARRKNLHHPWGGNAAWADAGVIIPWAVYQRTGDRRVLAENFAAMRAWIAYQENTSTDLVRPDTAYGDWVATDAVSPSTAPTPCDLIGTAYFAHTTDLTARAATLLGHAEEALALADLHRRVVAAFQREYVAPSGRLAGDTQTAYCLALAFDLLPADLRPAALAHLRRSLKRRHDHLATGFVGTPFLCPVLSAHGAHDLAVKLLLNEGYPSWLMPVKNGATTMWERWNSWTPDKGFGPVDMNSFNHYAFGAVGEWLYRDLAGLDTSAPGYRRLRFTPRPGDGLTHASAWHETPYGRAACGWKKKRDGRVEIDVTVPPNTSADLILPDGTTQSLRPGRHRLTCP
jgi:alpha-L-rhamnosidase